ncbi:MAG: 4-hydroxythreonine-4-phosphate dehydrogenase PdxA [Flavobacteriaceae bacterium]
MGDRPIVVTMGDPAGIGPELIGRAWLAALEGDCPRFTALADPELLRERFDQCELDVAVGGTDAGALPVDAPEARTARVVAGLPDSANAPAVIGAIDLAARRIREGTTSAMVTCPIAKHVLYDYGFAYPGHTEYLGHLAGELWGTPAMPVMMLASDDLRVVPVTIHIPLRDVAGSLDAARIFLVVCVTAEDLRARFGIERPRIAVAGLNPHAGEGGAMGREEADIIAPALADLRRKGFDVTGPLPADTMFHARARASYDVAITMYHDQALIPVKTIAFDSAVNVTLGLPFIRTSPDHGTAFDIAGKGIARPDSLIAAIRMAAAMAERSGG